MIQLRCPRCGESVSFGAADEKATCPKCEYSVQVQTAAELRARPREPDKDKDLTNAMLICAAIVVVSMGFPVFAGLFGKGAPKTCEIKSTPSASVFAEGELLGQTPLRVPRFSSEREITLKADGFAEKTINLPKEDDSSCDLTINLDR